MTSRQVGKRLSTLSRRRTRPAAQRGGRRQRQAAMTPSEQRKLAQLVVCAVAFAALVGVKLLLPERLAALGDTLSQAMSRNMDVTEVFSAVGRAVSGEDTVQDALGDVYQAVFGPSNAVQTAAPVREEGTAAALAPLRDYADGNGDASGWLPPANGPGEALELSVPTQAEAFAQTQESGLSYVLYDRENLPDNVSMEQALLGFDYSTPLKGTLTSGFGYREHPMDGEERFHYGLDIAANSGSAICCFASGTVSAVGESSSYGKYCVVAHEGGISTLYAHCSKVTVSSGASVAEGEKLAEVGQTGMATGPHLHFELHQGQTYLNPIYYVALQ